MTIDWRIDTYQGTAGVRRELRVQPAWDCICGPCARSDCPGHGAVGDRHGRSTEHWIYAVYAADGLTVLTLEMSSARSHPSTPDWIRLDDEARRLAGRRPSVTDLSLHCAFVTDQGGEGSSQTCMFLGGKPCHTHYTTSLGADDFWAKHGEVGASEPERLEAFWRALEARHAELDAEARATRIKTCPDCPPVCATCKGTGMAPDPMPGYRR